MSTSTADWLTPTGVMRKPSIRTRVRPPDEDVRPGILRRLGRLIEMFAPMPRGSVSKRPLKVLLICGMRPRSSFVEPAPFAAIAVESTLIVCEPTADVVPRISVPVTTMSLSEAVSSEASCPKAGAANGSKLAVASATAVNFRMILSPIMQSSTEPAACNDRSAELRPSGRSGVHPTSVLEVFAEGSRVSSMW